MANQLNKLLAQQERATQKKHEAEQQEKRLKKQISDLKNKERTHRLCNRGGYLEKLLQKPELFSDEEVFAFLDYVFSTPYAKDRLRPCWKQNAVILTVGIRLMLVEKRRRGSRENHRTFYVRCALIRTVPVRSALSEGPCGVLDGLRPSSGASPCADFISYPITVRGAEKTR